MSLSLMARSVHGSSHQHGAIQRLHFSGKIWRRISYELPQSNYHGLQSLSDVCNFDHCRHMAVLSSLRAEVIQNDPLLVPYLNPSFILKHTNRNDRRSMVETNVNYDSTRP